MVSVYSVEELPTTTDTAGYVAPVLPRTIDLAGEPLTLRRMTADDADRVQLFFLSLPSSDLLFLRRDVTDGREIDNWVTELERGETDTIIAESEGTVMGEATLHHTGVPWTRHIGIARVFVASEERGRGLGRVLLEEVCRLARGLAIQKLMAEMTLEQTAALQLMAQLGFAEEARLRNHVKDRYGCPHDIVIMTRNLIDFDRLRAEGCEHHPSAWRCTTCGVVSRAPESPDHCQDCGAGGGFVVPAGVM